MDVRRRVIFSGQVQGVFFRATTLELSRLFPVVGHVRNLADGTVELEAQGPAQAVDGLLSAIGGRYERNIQKTEVFELPLRDGERAFQVR